VWGESRTKTEAKSKVPSFEEYIRKYKILAMRHQKEYKIPASITLAQGLLESAAGDSYLAKMGNNHFGIKCKDTWDGKKIYHTDDAPDECFRRYPTVEDSYSDHSLFLAKRKYYTSLFRLDLYDYKGWAYGLQRCGYATDKMYGDKLVRLIETYELYKYDRTEIADYTKQKPVEDDEIYEISIATPERNRNFSISNWIRKIYENNGVHYVIARENDTYDMIAYDMQSRTSKILKYNEVPKDFKLNEGDIVYLQDKKKYATDHKSEIHVVAAGESLHTISQQYGIKLKSLYTLNRLKDSYIPKPGDTLKVSK
jgi:hypothetical protein